MDLNQKDKAKAVYKKLYTGLVRTVEVLESDFKFAVKHWESQPASQFWRRTLVRCGCAYVEGTLSIFKAISPETAAFFGVQLNTREISIATEKRDYQENGVKKTKTLFLPIRDNLKATLKLLLKSHGLQTPIEFTSTQFDDLCRMFELRNKLMHPKGIFDLGVTDEAIDTAERGMAWFGIVITEVLRECGKKLPYQKSGS